ncbi:hypothetical protein [Paenibacillus hexagrammi]|uniref:Uncharacterized protein n=1 Tax=Paenibacillus hexagrammi TaxID=2908839 RepID=A0ABY3SQI6_9BACL|nr:hypothetical protein [Paenibacillus sp. YPD9-1]UJF36322.1 hypothetical protein L0M14_10825 [Paenibacillus sp. YPD9-1]
MFNLALLTYINNNKKK